MKRRSLLLLLLRASLGLLVLIWGLDELVNVTHGLIVSEHFDLDALIIFAGSFVLWAFRDEDHLVLGRGRGAPVRGAQ